LAAVEHNVRAAEVVKAAVGDGAGETVAEGLAGEAGGGVVGLGEDAVALVGGCGDEVARIVGPGLGIPVTEGMGERAVGGIVGAGEAVGAAVEEGGLGLGLRVREVCVVCGDSVAAFGGLGEAGLISPDATFLW